MSDAEFTAIPVRPCIKCGSTERYPRPGMLGPCKACSAVMRAKYRENNKEKNRAIEYAWVANNKERVRANKNAWRLANKDKIKASGAKYYAGNREKVDAANNKWKAENADKVKKAASDRKKAHPEIVRVHNQNRRARKAAVGGKLSMDIEAKLFKLQKGKCACCGKSLASGHHLDHITPLSLGGRNEDSNMQLLTPLCNLQKHAKHPVDFMQERGFLL